MTAPVRTHPAWCDPDECTAAVVAPYGAHRSVPVPANPAGHEPVQLHAHLEQYAGLPSAAPWLVLTATSDYPEVVEESHLPVSFVMDLGQAAALRGVLGGLLLTAGRGARS